MKAENQLFNAGFQYKKEWDYSPKKGVHRKVFTKRVGNDVIKAYKHERGFTFGILYKEGSPLCSMHWNDTSTKELKAYERFREAFEGINSAIRAKK